MRAVFIVNRLGIEAAKQMLYVTSLKNALAAMTPAEREHHLTIAGLVKK